jgi:hypothetical protein
LIVLASISDHAGSGLWNETALMGMTMLGKAPFRAAKFSLMAERKLALYSDRDGLQCFVLLRR